MNDILMLKGRFEQRDNRSGYGTPQLPRNSSVTSSHLLELADQLSRICTYWCRNTEIGGALVSVHYRHVVAKSNRIRALLSEGSKNPAASVCGARFVWENGEEGKTVQKHVFTHYISIEAVEKSIGLLNAAASIVDQQYHGQITSENTERIAKHGEYYAGDAMAKSVFLKVILDGNYVERFAIDYAEEDVTQDTIITIYRTAIDTTKLLEKFDIHIAEDMIIDKTTLRLTPDEARQLYDRAGYLIAMSLTDFSEIHHDDVLETPVAEMGSGLIPEPVNEPIIGVIDTQFNEHVYFNDWVDYRNMLDADIPLTPEDYYHGTEVSYIIVDGPKGNPDLEDGCGRFRVRHFGVATHGGFSSFSILRMIKNIVAQNRDIKVWNLSLGSRLEIRPNFISPEAALLDQIQSEYDVTFVVAGTNAPLDCRRTDMRIGSPADSLNSIVVNSVTISGRAASYTRTGPVLSFFNKPDLSYYGGDGADKNDKIIVCHDDLGAVYVAGTSYAAPWITRKLAYLIHVMGLSREVSKALLIDSAAGWHGMNDRSRKIGYGVVPRHIQDIIHSAEDEIRFILTGTADSYETYTYNLPVPVINDAHPYYARATLVYYPQCNRNQGVDYTCTEMDLHFGRVSVKNDKACIKTINLNRQADDGYISIHEEEARSMYRKWDNVKHISEEIKDRRVPRRAYDSGLWGISIKTKERNTASSKEPLRFGIVVTLKEMYGTNRIDEFMRLCMARGWLVSRLDVQNQIDIYTKAEEDIEFE